MSIAPSDLEWQFRHYGSATVVLGNVTWRIVRTVAGYSATATIPALGGPVEVRVRTTEALLRACEAVGAVGGPPDAHEGKGHDE